MKDKDSEIKICQNCPGFVSRPERSRILDCFAIGTKSWIQL